MRKRMQKIGVVLLILSMVMGGLTWRHPQVYALSEEAGIEENIRYDEEKTRAEIELTVKNTEKNKISEVQDPQGNVMEMDHLIWGTTENGSYTFKAKLVEMETGAVREIEKTVEVKDIREKEEETEPTLSKAEETPVTVSADSAVGTTISLFYSDGRPYDPNAGVNGTYSGGELVAKVRIQFPEGDNIKNRKATISIPLGLRYTKIPVVEGRFNVGIAKDSLLAKVTSDDPLYNAITKTTVPGESNKDVVGSQTYGALEYEFAEGVNLVTLEVRFRSTHEIQSSAKTFTDGIVSKASADINDTTTQLKEDKHDIKITGKFERYIIGTLGDKTLYTDGKGKVIGRTQAMQYYPRIVSGDSSHSIYSMKTEYTFHYPEGSSFERVFYNMNNQWVDPAKYFNVEYTVDEVNHSVTVTLKQNQGNPFLSCYTELAVEYSYPENVKEGVYEYPGEQDSITSTWYDGTTTTDYRGAISQPVEIQKTLEEKNQLDVDLYVYNADQVAYNDADVEGLLSYGPHFRISNNTLTKTDVTDQMVEINIDPKWQTDAVLALMDVSDGDKKLTKLEYTTNKTGSNNWQTFELPNGKEFPEYAYKDTKIIDRKTLGITAEDEYITGIRYELGTVKGGIKLGNSSTGRIGINTIGRLAEGASEADITVTTYDKNDRVNTESTASGKVKRTPSDKYGTYLYLTPNVTLKDTAGSTTLLVAGSTYTMRVRSGLDDNQTYLNSTAIKNPVFYIREVGGIQVDVTTFKLSSRMGNGAFENIPLKSIDSYTDASGVTVHKVTAKDPQNFGWFFGFNDRAMKIFDLTYDFTVDKRAGDKVVNAGRPDTAMVMMETKDKLYQHNGLVLAQNDLNDVNQNGDTSELLYTLHTSYNYTIVPTKGVLVDSYLNLEGKNDNVIYRPGIESTISNFTPGTKADYTFSIFNNSEQPTNNGGFIGYIPIPKTGQDFGSDFQEAPFQWDMKLSKLIDDQSILDLFDIEYATDADKDNYKNANYTKTPANIKDVNMIRVTMKGNLPAGSQLNIKIPLIIDEDMTSAQTKQKTMNVYNSVYHYETADFNQDVKGGKVGARLVIAEISGKMFKDNNKNGVYDDGDTFLSGKSIELYKLENGTYVQATDDKGTPITVTTGTDGSFKFDEHHQLSYETYALKFPALTGIEKYTLYSAPGTEDASNVINTGTDAGWIRDISATDPKSTKLGAGIMEYDESRLAIETMEAGYRVRERQTLTLQPTITPDYFDNIKDATNGYHWELVDDGDKVYIELGNTNQKDVIVTAKAKPADDHTIGVRLTITDAYGNTVNKTTEITVQTNEAPVLTLPEVLEMNVGDTWDASDPDIVRGLSISDDHDRLEISDITIDDSSVPTDSVSTWDHIVNFFTGNSGKTLREAGTYTVSYTVQDSDKNETRKLLKLKVNGLPYLTTADSDTKLDNSNLPANYMRVGGSMDIAGGLKAFYEKAPEVAGGATVKTEIKPEDASTGSVTIKAFVDKDGKPVTNINNAGKYTATADIVTPTGGTTEIERDVYIRGKIQNTTSTAIAVRDDTASYTKVEDLFNKYNAANGISWNFHPEVEVVDESGNVTKEKIDVTNMIIENLDKISFERTEEEKKKGAKPITLHINITDPGETGKWGSETITAELHITLQDTTGDVPTITFKAHTAPTERTVSDKIPMNPENISSLEDYEKAEDKAYYKANPKELYKKLMNDAIFEDGPDAVNGFGIKTSGIVSIKKLIGADGAFVEGETIIQDDAEAQQTDAATLDKILKIYTEVGHYEVTYFAEDLDGNYVESSRHIHTAGDTEFKENGTDAGTEKQLITSTVAYAPATGFKAIHTDYDGTAEHDTGIHPINAVDISQIDVKTVTLNTTHHYGTYGETGVPREADSFTRTLYINGPLEWESSAASQDHFVNDEVDLKDNVRAFYMKATTADDHTGVKEPVTVTNSTGQDVLTSTDARKHTITFTAEDAAGTEHTKQKDYVFYGLPELTLGQSTIQIGENTTPDEVTALIAATGQVATYNGSVDPVITHDYTNYAGVTDGKITVTAAYTLPDGTATRSTTGEVTVEKIAAPKLTAHDITINVGDAISREMIIDRSGLEINHPHLGKDDVKITSAGISSIGPGAAALQSGTHAITMNAQDSVGNKSEITILLKINGLPKITGIEELQGYAEETVDLEEGVEAVYRKAQDRAGAEAKETRIDNLTKTIKKIDAAGNKTNVSAIDKAGVYEVSYEAENGSGGKTSKVRSVRIHEEVKLEGNSITIRRGESEQDFLNKFRDELGIQAEVIEYKKTDGKEENVTHDLYADKKISIDLSQVKWDTDGSYDAVIKATVDYPDMKKTEKTKTIRINVGDMQGRPPVVQTHDKARQSDDPLIGETNIQDYLESSAFIEAVKGDYEIAGTTLVRIEPQTKTREGRSIAIHEDGLKEMMKSVGLYTLTYEVKDTAGNVVTATQQLEVMSPVRFAILKADGTLEDIDSSFDAREKTSMQTIVYYQERGDGSIVRHPAEISGNTALDKVAVQRLNLKGASLLDTYEDGSRRPEAKNDVLMLVQGAVRFEMQGNIPGEINTYVGSEIKIPDGLKAYVDIIDEKGDVQTKELKYEVIQKGSTDKVGKEQLLLKAEDSYSQAPQPEGVLQIDVHVNGIPVIEAEDVKITKGSDIAQIVQAANAKAWYVNSDGNEIDLTGHIRYEFKDGTLVMMIDYEDQNETKTVTKSIRVIEKEPGISTTPDKDKKGKGNKDIIDKVIEGVRTGDTASLTIWIILILSATGGMLVLRKGRRRKEKA